MSFLYKCYVTMRFELSYTSTTLYFSSRASGILRTKTNRALFCNSSFFWLWSEQRPGNQFFFLTLINLFHVCLSKIYRLVFWKREVGESFAVCVGWQVTVYNLCPAASPSTLHEWIGVGTPARQSLTWRTDLLEIVFRIEFVICLVRMRWRPEGTCL
jgi:hypothetical protein